ncbi:hypothetical protein [Ruegeria sp. MALMAid1280]|uniref:hypothetical protein n=1 Tax=Ruegeria sp. MALMAid1280 TaxID=3411634 RepID=UPI003B9E3902
MRFGSGPEGEGLGIALKALHLVAPGSLNRIISMSGAVYLSRTLGALDTPAGHMAEFIDVISRENDLFDFLFEWMILPPQRGDRSFGIGLQAPNAVTLQLD